MGGGRGVPPRPPFRIRGSGGRSLANIIIVLDDTLTIRDARRVDPPPLLDDLRNASSLSAALRVARRGDPSGFLTSGYEQLDYLRRVAQDPDLPEADRQRILAVLTEAGPADRYYLELDRSLPPLARGVIGQAADAARRPAPPLKVFLDP